MWPRARLGRRGPTHERVVGERGLLLRGEAAEGDLLAGEAGLRSPLLDLLVPGHAVHLRRLLRGGHLKLTLVQGEFQREAIAWRWQQSQPLPKSLDVAFKVNLNRWQGEAKLQLEIQALREHHASLDLRRSNGVYRCRRQGESELEILNRSGEKLSIRVNSQGVFESEDNRARHPYVADLIREACIGLGLIP